MATTFYFSHLLVQVITRPANLANCRPWVRPKLFTCGRVTTAESTMIVLAALALLLANVQFGRSCDGEGDVLICTNFPPYFSPGYSTLVMYLRDLGEINSTVFRSANLTSVTRLRLDGAGVTGIAEGAFVSFQNLTSLSLNNNALVHISPNWLGRPAVLGELSLAGNQIEVLNESMLRGLVALTKLSLHNNNIGTIGPNAFSSQANLAELDLSDNRLTRISSEVFGVFRSIRIRLHRNPWDCSCGAEDSVASLKDLWIRSLLDAQMDVTCESPPPLKGTSVWNVSDVCATPPAHTPPSGSSAAPLPSTIIAAAASPSQPAPDTRTSVRPRPTDTVTTAALTTAIYATSSPLTTTSVYPKPSDSTITVSPYTNVTETAPDATCILIVVTAASVFGVLLFAVGLLAALHRRKRNNKIVIPGRPNEDDNRFEEGGVSGGHSERSGPEKPVRRHFPGARAKSANAVLSRSSFCLSSEDHVGLQKVTEAQAKVTKTPDDRMQKPAQAEADREIQAEGVSDTELVVKSEKGADAGRDVGEKLHCVPVHAETAPYLSIGTNRGGATQQSTDGRGPGASLGNVMGRISTWPPTAVQWQARCKLGQDGSDVLTGWAQSGMLTFSSEPTNKSVHPSVCDGVQMSNDKEQSPGLPTTPSVNPHTMNEADVILRNPNDEVASLSEAYTHTDVTRDPAAGRRTQREIHNLNVEEFQGQDCKPAETPAHEPTGERNTKAEQRREPKAAAASRSTGSKAPSGGTSPYDTLQSGNEYAFMDLLHEVVQNNGRWTRERWKQMHVNKQRR